VDTSELGSLRASPHPFLGPPSRCHCCFSNLAIKPGALAKLNLPVQVKRGTLGLFKLHVPWHKLGYEPVICEISDIHLVANFNKWSRETQDEAAFSTKMSEVKSRMEEVLQQVMADRTAESGTGEEARTWSSSLMENIVDNVQVTIKNIHIRFEEDGVCSHAPAPFAVGIVADEFTSFTCDKDERPFFSKVSPSLPHANSSP